MAEVITVDDILNAYGAYSYNNGIISYGQISENRHQLIDMFRLQLNHETILDISEDPDCICGCKTIIVLIHELIRRPLEYPIDFFNYILEKEYERKEDENFQNKMFKLLCNKYFFMIEENNGENSDFFEYALNHYLLPETIRMHDVHEEYSTTLFHKLFFAGHYMGDEYMDRMFTLFDNAGFDYNVIGCASLMGLSFMQNIPYIMRKLHERGLSVQTEIVANKIAKKIRLDMCIMKTASEQTYQYHNVKHIQTVDLWNAVHRIIYDNHEHILFFADLQKCNEEVEERLLLIMNEVDPHFDQYTSMDEYTGAYSKYSREFSFPTSTQLQLYYSTFQCLKELGYDMNTLIEANDLYGVNMLMPMTPLDIYLRGSKHFELLHHDLHEMFVDIFT